MHMNQTLKSCPDCKRGMRRVEVAVEGAAKPAISYQCPRCEHFEFETVSAKEVVAELKALETPLKIRQKIIKLSQNRLGVYFSKDVIRSLKLKPGEEIALSVPDKKHIVLSIEQ